jgi:adenylate cyclase class 2
LIEAELKARVEDPESVRGLLLAAAGDPERAEYADTYFDRSGQLAADGRELRVRTVTTDAGVRHVLTYKGGVLDTASGSKTEAETLAADRGALEEILEGLGYRRVIAFTKVCENYRLATLTGRPVLATLVTVPELDGVFLEVETAADDESDMRAGLGALRALLLDLEIGPGDLTTELYTDAVAAARSDHGQASPPEPRRNRFTMYPGDIEWKS